MMNAKLSLHGFCYCHENGLIKTIQMIPHNLYVSLKLAIVGKVVGYRLNRLHEPVFMAKTYAD